MKQKYNNLETAALHEGYVPDATHSRVAPIYRNTAYVFDSPQHAANLFALKEFGNIYTRLGNPTIDVLEKKVAALEGGAAAVCFASGTAAIFNAILNLAKSGEEFIAANNIYGGTITMFNNILADCGVKVNFVDPYNNDNFKAAITEKTRAIFIETIGNPTLGVVDIEAIAKIAHDAGLPLVIDATFTTPRVIRSIDYGADIVINSLTKWMAGHGCVIGGSVVDAGKFKWADNPRFAAYNTPVKSYKGLRWAHDLGPLNSIAYAMRLRTVWLRNAGACLSPDNAWQISQGIETFALRVERHSAHALEAAKYLEKHPKIEWVRYPGLESDPSHVNAKKYFNGVYGGMVVINLKEGKAAGEKFISSLSLFSHLANVGDTRSLAIHPASTTHSQLSEEEQLAGGITTGQVRLSIGIEHIDDIIKDLEQALSKV